MRITDLDKRRAIRRIPEFQKDLASYRRIKDPHKKMSKALALEKKWFFSPEAIERADDVAQHRKDTPTIEAVYRISDEPYIIIYRGEEKTPSSLTGKSLYLKITLYGKTEAQLVKDFKRTIKPYRNLLTMKERNRKSDSFEDIWKVYDLYLECGKNLNETTRQAFGVTGSPIYHWDESLLKQIKTAVSNAKAIIASIKRKIA